MNGTDAKTIETNRRKWLGKFPKVVKNNSKMQCQKQIQNRFFDFFFLLSSIALLLLFRLEFPKLENHVTRKMTNKNTAVISSCHVFRLLHISMEKNDRKYNEIGSSRPFQSPNVEMKSHFRLMKNEKGKTKLWDNLERVNFGVASSHTHANID